MKMLEEATEIAKDAAALSERAVAFAKAYPAIDKYAGLSTNAVRAERELTQMLERVTDLYKAVAEARKGEA